jgi:hypothetical protein
MQPDQDARTPTESELNQSPPPARPRLEPVTAQALWPTFMRRTLPEDALLASRPH